MGHGRSLQLFFVDGTADGILTAEMFNWTGHVLSAPRTRIADMLARSEARHTGVYLLLGADERGPRLYVGEAEDVSARIKTHDQGKDWWDRCVIVTTGRQELHKAHVRYLEARLISKAAGAGRADLDNGTRPLAQGLTEAALASMEEFLDTLDIVLPAIGVDALLSGEVSGGTVREKDRAKDVQFVLETPRNDISAKARLDAAKFVMLKGSKVRAAWMGQGEHDFGYRNLHDQLVKSGAIDVSSTPAVLTTDFEFNSPSAAAAVANGRPANGRIEWKTLDGRTFAEWEAAQVEARIGGAEE